MSSQEPLRLVEAEAGEGRAAVRLTMFDTGRGWAGCLTGGDSPHVGGVVLAIPRPSLSGSGATSCDLYSLPVPGHLDNDVGLQVAKGLCTSLQAAVSLTSGIHIEHASPDEVRAIGESCLAAQERFLALANTD